ncbi:hypothetical protein HYH02_002417 [Chlamydomonas schloesseri]|uniref:Uncharacterized protein n=1 Tax=Chlamydomonas schloesseri TaxID=2026947 RepID=A0A835WSV2_9CHLO|nr:hypothetical protein HYH02_002417 [Chlamydomonas schloesseri]|eukprot:KAG2453085.1 hypothetical protein HYH02_002417 [Chlamydomonas schloesseri]
MAPLRAAGAGLQLALQLDAALGEAVAAPEPQASAQAPAPAAAAAPPSPSLPPLLTVSVLHSHHLASEGASVLGTDLAPAAPPGCYSGTRTDTDTSSSEAPCTNVYEHFYPINALRNAALAHARSSHVFLVDGDFIPCAGLREDLLARRAAAPAAAPGGGGGGGSGGGGGGGAEGVSGRGARSLGPVDESDAHARPVMWVVPAFELAAPAAVATSSEAAGGPSGGGGGGVGSPQVAAVAEVPDEQSAEVPRTLGQLLSYEAGLPQQGGSTVLGGAPGRPVLRPFHCGRYPQPLPSVDYAGWLEDASAAAAAAAQPQPQPERSEAAQQEGGLQWIEVPYHEYFEPYGVVRRDQVPFYDERFRGYGLNKVQHAYHMAAAGFQFRLLRRHFCVTVPHKRSPSYRAAFGTAADPEQRRRVEQLYTDFKTEMRQRYGYEYGSAGV